jgi:hypothetical protein
MFAFCDTLSLHVTTWSHVPSLAMPLFVNQIDLSNKTVFVSPRKPNLIYLIWNRSLNF